MLLKDKNDKVCVAKNVFVSTITLILTNYITYYFFSIGSFDSTTSIALLTTTGAVYYGRSHTKGV